jgi:N-acetylmuramic acid 6-phosphate etherase
MEHLLTEARNPASTNLDELTSLELVRLMNAEDAKVPPAVAAEAEHIARAIEVIAERLRRGGRLVYAGAGTSGRLGVLDAAECPPTFRTPPGLVVGLIAGGPAALTTAVEGAEDHPEFAERDLQAINLSGQDVLVGIATSGRTPYVVGALRHARAVGAPAIGLACVPDSELRPHADLMITPLVGPEVLTGSTRLKAGTATKLVLNMLSTGTMVRLGKTHGNLMVDLRATNTKLRARANRIVRHFTGLSREAADELLAACGWEVKTALVAQQAQLDPVTARRRLEAVGGQVRLAVGATLPASGGLTPPDPSSGGSRPPLASAANLVLGIDGGGSHTVALLAALTPGAASPWQVLGRGKAGPSNLQAIGLERAGRSLTEAVAGAFNTAGLPRGPVAAACLGLAGAGRPEDQERIRRWAEAERLAETVEVMGDVPLLLAAGTPDGWGVAVVAGTGSISWGRAPDGRTARAGGWGPLLGDEGSAHALVLAALRAVVAATDGRAAATALTERLLPAMGLPNPQALIAALHGGTWDRARLAGLAPLVVAAAGEGDAAAAGLLRDGARELAQAVRAVVTQLDLPRTGFPLALAGGLLLANAGYRQLFLEELERWTFMPGRVELVAEPAEGAVRLAVQRRHAQAR